MQQPQTLPGSGKVSLVYGLIFGLIIGAIDVAYVAILDVTNPPFLQPLYQALSSLHNDTLNFFVSAFIISIPLYILLFVVYVIAGLFAARKTKKVSTGLLAGFWTGVVFVIMDVILADIALLYLITFPQLAQNGMSAADLANFKNSVLILNISYSLIIGLVLIGLGLGIGALGGLLGKGKTTPALPYATPYPNPYQPYQAPMYANPGQQPPYGQNPPPGQSQ